MTKLQDNHPGTRSPTLRVWPSPANINHNGHIFGGWILSQMDIAGGIVATRLAHGPVATVAIEAMKFHKPMLVSDWVSVYTDIEKTGRTSITVRIEVAALRRDTEEEIKITEGTFIYVAINEAGRPRPVDAS